MIKEDYVSFEIAKLLKEKGFDGDGGDCECHMFYCDYTEERIMPICEIGLIPDNEEAFFAPTHQMAMKWLRDIYSISIEPYCYEYGWYCGFSQLPKGITIYTSQESKEYGMYEEAVEAALKYSLENLI